jgi:hypothetical protein
MILTLEYAAYEYVSRMQPKGNFIQVAVSQPLNPFLPFPLYLETVLLQCSFVKLCLYG